MFGGPAASGSFSHTEDSDTARVGMNIPGYRKGVWEVFGDSPALCTTLPTYIPERVLQHKLPSNSTLVIGHESTPVDTSGRLRA